MATHLFVLVCLVIEGSIYFIEKLVVAMTAEIMQMIQLGLINAGSSMRSLLALLSAMETSLRMQKTLESVSDAISTCIYAPCILAMATI